MNLPTDAWNHLLRGTCHLLEVVGGGVGKQVQFFSQGNFSYAFPQFPAEKTVTLPLVWPKKVMTFLMLKDMTGIIKRDQLLPCAVHNRKRVGLLTDLLGVVTREEFS